MFNLLLQSTNFLNQCQYNISFLDYDGWIGITMLVIIASLMVAAIVYGFSGLLTVTNREKLRGVVKYEYIQGVFSLILIIVLFGMSLTACDIGGLLTQGLTTYQDPFQFSRYYIGNLLFSKGITLTTNLFNEGVVFVIDAFFVTYGLSLAASFVPPISVLGVGSIKPAGLAGGSLDAGSTIIYDYSSVLNALLAPIVVVTFGLLFVLFLVLPAVEALALTVVIPVAIIMRSLAFVGPKLREVSNALIAVSVAFYFVLPLTLAMNYYAVNWIYCINGVANCNPYVSYIQQPYQLNTLPVSQLFTTPASSTINGGGLFSNLQLPLNFYQSVIQGNGGFSSMSNAVITGFITLPNILSNYTYNTAQYLFQGIFLIALDAAITIGFAVGLHKGLETLGQMFAIGPFWSG